MNPLLIVLVMVSFLIGCEAEVNQTFNTAITDPTPKATTASVTATAAAVNADPSPTPSASASPRPSPSPAFSNTDCWNNKVKKNGSTYAAYSTASRAANNTWYDCTGSGSVGGIWIAFYRDNTIYWGGLSPGFVFNDPAVNNSDCSKFEWKNSSGEVYGYATDATLATDGKLLTITITKWISNTNRTYYPVETLSCSEIF